MRMTRKLNCPDLIASIVKIAKQEQVDNIRFNGYDNCLSRNSSTKERKALSSVFLSEEEYDSFVKELFREYDTKGALVKKHVEVQDYVLVFTGIDSSLLDSGKYLLSIRLIKKSVGAL